MREEVSYGLWFGYKNHKLSNSRLMEQDEMEWIDKSCTSQDHVYVFCRKCSMYMIFEKSYYICKSCGAKLRETTVLRKLEKENDAWLEKIEGEIPEGCSACGGPYPDCESSCGMWD